MKKKKEKLENSKKKNSKIELEIQKLHQEINNQKRKNIDSEEKWRTRFEKWGEEIETLRKKNKDLKNKLDENNTPINTSSAVSESIKHLTKNFKKLQHFLEMECPKTLELDPSEHREEMHALREEVSFLKSKHEKEILEKEAKIELLKARVELKETNRLSLMKETMRESISKLTEENNKELKQLISRNNILKEKLLNQVHQQESIIYLKKKLIEKDKIVKIKNRIIADLKSQVTLRELEIDQLRDAIMNFQKALEMKSIVEMRNASMKKFEIK